MAKPHPADHWRLPMAPQGGTCRAARQRGTSLVEALLSLLVVTVGMLALARQQNGLRTHSDQVQQRAEAFRLAQQTLEQWRSFGDTPAPAPDTAAPLTQPEGSNTRYQVQQQAQTGTPASTTQVQVAVAWTARSGEPQQLQLSTLLPRQPPSLSGGLLAPARQGQRVAPVLGRAVGIPLDAAWIDTRRSAFKPQTSGTEAWVLDNLTGEVLERCTGVPSARTSRQLSAHDLGNCSPQPGRLLSGWVILPSAQAPTTPGASDGTSPTPLPSPAPLDGLAVQIEHTAGDWACLQQSLQPVRYRLGDQVHHDWLPLDQTATQLGASEWTPLGPARLAYHCRIAVTHHTAPRRPDWSGRSVLQPQGWTVGEGNAQHRVCRQTHDSNGNGQIDEAAEHPGSYSQVRGPLQHQNFLLTAEGAACPPTSTPPAGAWPSPATVQHQP